MNEAMWAPYAMIAAGSLMGLFATFRILMQSIRLLFWVVLLVGGVAAASLGTESLGDTSPLENILPFDSLPQNELTDHLRELPQEARGQLRALCEEL
jgi:hypothetical protein